VIKILRESFNIGSGTKVDWANASEGTYVSRDGLMSTKIIEIRSFFQGGLHQQAYRIRGKGGLIGLTRMIP